MFLFNHDCKKILHLVVFFVFLSNQYILGATTGKLAGMVSEKNGNPIAGVNIIVEGLLIGGATDIDGNFFILKIPPGPYSVSASMIGYKKHIITEVIIQGARTTKINFILEEAIIEGEEIVVVAVRPVIEVDRTSTEFIVSAQDIVQAPIVGNIKQYMKLMPGVGEDTGGKMIIRGSDNSDIVMNFDGIPLDDYKDINMFSIEEASITTGGIGAEYGNAQGGLINVITKDGGEKLSGTVEYSISPPQQGHWGENYWEDAYHLDVNGNSRLHWDDPTWVNEIDTLTGRKVHEKIDYTDITSQSIKLALSGPLFVKGLHFSLGTQFSQGSGGAMAVTRYSLPYTNNNWKLTYRPIPSLTLRTGGFYSWSKGYNSGSFEGTGVSFRTSGLSAQEIEGAIRGMRIGSSGQYIDDRNIFLPLDYSAGGTHTNENYLLYFGVTHMLSRSTFYDLKVYQQQSTSANQDIPDTVIAKGRTDDSGWYYIEGGKGINYTDAKTIRSGLKLDLTSQISKSNLVKVGIDYQNYDLWQTSITHVATVRSLSRISNDFESGESIKPVKIAAYLSDKMEFGGLVVNVGARYDYFDWGAKFPVTYALAKLARPYNSFTRFRDLPSELWIEPKPLTALSPRLGLSHPIADKATIHFFYGHLYQLPSFWNMYHDEWKAKNPRNPDKDINKNGVIDPTEEYNRLNDTSNRLRYGNPNLEYEKTTNFEMGIDWNFYQNYILTTTLYYKSAQNQVKGGSTHQFWDPNRDAIAPYINIRNNTQYEDAKGFEIFLKKRFGRMFSFQVSLNIGWATEGWSGERVRTYVPDASFVEKYYFEKYTGDTNGDGVVDELDSGAEVPVPLGETRLLYLKNKTEENIQRLQDQGVNLKPVDEIDGLYYYSTHYSAAGHPRENIERRTSLGLMLYLDLPDDYGFSIFGFKPFENFHANMTYRYHAGLPYQYTSMNGMALWRMAPLSSSANLRMEKSFNFAGLKNTLFLTISNLFNNQELNNSSSFSNVVNLSDYVNYGLEGYSPIYDYDVDYRGKTDGGIYLGAPRRYAFGLRITF